ncbi:expressed unknown protein [Seminavis robusta]|uniref:Uncharacterized protein n=1 Tax=Seminavis robusta TaxID=568900 RepID=A0A9N8DGT6_9STRA|nr:expressed unknown protein [Seminavis robusta]|eukprot:Sro84_g044820.1 n/a (293) ;mRNA; f:60541-61419
MSSSPSAQFPVWELPEVILYHIVGYVAPPTHRAGILCHRVAPLCKAAHRVVFEEARSVALWDAVLAGDYQVDTAQSDKRKGTRSCKRLKRSPCQKVRDAHRHVIDNTEFAYYYLSELAHKSGKAALTSPKLRGILDEYGPQLRINHRVSSGGAFLVEVCRARHVKEAVILKSLQELVEHRGANVNTNTFEAQNSNLTGLCVAAVRGMPTVVKYLLGKGASTTANNAGRFRLVTNSRKSLRCANVTALGFAQAMRQAEIDNGACEGELKNLNKCIELLTEQQQTQQQQAEVAT